eukprot:TRINITY_DN4524_c0_g1_i2.p1 TRINITY_DN4524_c0_g1~~TRINITY_DN4524_c0_g1_i2.p1  ORF type:complete len:209 (-),score=65.99 TRINITY_DN4524_c0_g1_i2:106-732(-)
MDFESAETVERFLKSMEEFTPTIPDEVTNYFLQKTGFNCPDLRTKRVIALATQKFISEIANDAMQHCKIRQQNSTVRDRASSRSKDKKLVLTIEDLSSSLKEYGIALKKPDYFADKAAAGLSAPKPDAKGKEKAPSKSSKGSASSTPIATPSATTASSPLPTAPGATISVSAKDIKDTLKAHAAKAKTAGKTGKKGKRKSAKSEETED